MEDTYTAPAITEIGTLAGLTLLSKEFNQADGVMVNGQPVGNLS